MDQREKVPTKSVSIRFPVALLEELHQIAQHHNRSVNGEVLTAVREHIRKSQQKEQTHG